MTALAVPAPQTTEERLLRLFTRAPKAFWRVDCDLRLERALDLARVAHLAGVSAEFFVMPRTHAYNIFSGPAESLLRELRDLGQRVGLHVDHRQGPVEAVVARDQQLVRYSGLGGLIDAHRVSFHMPTAAVLWKDWASFESAYASKWEGRYVSDARREWDDAKEARISNDIQVCLHAEHWFP